MATGVGQVMKEDPGSTSVLLNLSCTLESPREFKNRDQANQNFPSTGPGVSISHRLLSKFQCSAGLRTSLLHTGKPGHLKPLFYCLLGERDRDEGTGIWSSPKRDTLSVRMS